MIPVTFDKDAERQGTVSSRPTSRRRRLFVAMGLAAGGLLVLALALLGYSHKSDFVTQPVASVQTSPIQGQDVTVDLSSSTVSTVLSTSPLQTVPYLFRKYTVPAVAITTIVLVLLVVLAVVLPIALSQSVEEVPVVADPGHLDPEPEPEPEVESKPGFFDSSLNLGLVIGVVVGLVVIGAASFGVYHLKVRMPAKVEATRTQLIEDIECSHGEFKNKPFSTITKEEKACFVLNNSAKLLPTAGLATVPFHPLPNHKLGRYNQILAQRDYFLSAKDTEFESFQPVVLRAKLDVRYLGLDDDLPENCKWEPVWLKPENLKTWDIECLNDLLEFVNSLKSMVDDDIVKIVNMDESAGDSGSGSGSESNSESSSDNNSGTGSGSGSGDGSEISSDNGSGSGGGTGSGSGSGSDSDIESGSGSGSTSD